MSGQFHRNSVKDDDIKWQHLNIVHSEDTLMRKYHKIFTFLTLLIKHIILLKPALSFAIVSFTDVLLLSAIVEIVLMRFNVTMAVLR